MLRGRAKHQGTSKCCRRKGEKKKKKNPKKKKKGKAVCFSAVFPKTSLNTYASRLTAVSGDGDLLGWRRNIPSPELSAYVGAWFPGQAGLWAALLLPWSITSTLTHKAAGARRLGQQTAAHETLGESKTKTSHMLPSAPSRSSLSRGWIYERICSCCTRPSTFRGIGPFTATRTKEKQSLEEGTALGNPALPLNRPSCYWLSSARAHSNPLF